MGRLRNLSWSLKHAAFHSSSGQSSPTAEKYPDSPLERAPTKDVPVVTREASWASVNDTGMTMTRPQRHSTFPSVARPMSQFYDPPTMSATVDAVDELKPVFSFLTGHQGKTYQEGYFLKLNDLDSSGKPHADRNWTECFAQLVGTELSLWDAAALDAAGNDYEVPPSFINLADASIKMIETLPTRNKNIEPLKNVLSISTAGKNRYLLHFNNIGSLMSWTAGIRLAMFEHASLQELYTGSLIAGKGKFLNNIRSIMEKSRFVVEDWCRVRFGAGTPWRRCWYRIEPADEKEWQKANKSMKKKGPYERVVYPKGTLKFFDTKKTKKAIPIATIKDVYSAYAVYPLQQALIDHSTLVKLEGKITIHSTPESHTEGFVFVMPELHTMVSGFEMLLRFLFPTYDTFALYGRPNRLVADPLDARGLMFGMPKNRGYGYLEIFDVKGLIQADNSATWTEREWRKRMKDLVSKRMGSPATDRNGTVDQNGRRSLGSRPAVRFDNATGMVSGANQSTDAVFEAPKKTYTAPAAAQSTPAITKGHGRSVSESMSMASPDKRNQRNYRPSKLSQDHDPDPSLEQDIISPPPLPANQRHPYEVGVATQHGSPSSNASSDSDLQNRVDPEEVVDEMMAAAPPTPVPQPMFQHEGNEKPAHKPRARPGLSRESSRLSRATLDQLMDASKPRHGGAQAGAAAAAAWKHGQPGEQGRGVTTDLPRQTGSDANSSRSTAVSPGSAREIAPFSQTVASSLVPRPVLPIPPARTQQFARKPLPSPSTALSQEPNDPFADSKASTDLSTTNHRGPGADPTEISRQGGGVRKVVGNPSLNPTAQKQNDIPDIDFGITPRLSPSNAPLERPVTATNFYADRRALSPSSPRSGAHERSTSASPRGMGRVLQKDRDPSQVPSRPVSQMWQPPAQQSDRQSSGGLTAEEFVQQRFLHARLSSALGAHRSTTHSRGEESRAGASPESSPRNKLQKKRPDSRLDSRGSTPTPDYNGQLSAREQEHLARMSGGPLINLPDRARTPDPSVGLVGTIQGREQARRDMRQGISNQLAENEMARHSQPGPAPMHPPSYGHAYVPQVVPLVVPYQGTFNAVPNPTYEAQDQQSRYGPQRFGQQLPPRQDSLWRPRPPPSANGDQSYGRGYGS